MKFFRKRRNIFITGGLLIILSFGFVKTQDKDFELVKSLDIFYSLFRELNLFYVDETDPADLIETGIEAMLNSLDPYTSYISESEMDDFNFMTTGNYGGIGSLIRKSGSYVIIADPYEGSPAAEAGLKAGDKILSINNFNAKNKEISTVSEKLKGEPGTEITLEIRRPGEEKNRKIKITRENIHIDNVSYHGTIENNTGYIRLSNFTLGAGKEVKDAFTELKQNDGIDKLVLDLRGNPGGLLIEAVRVCNLFIDKGELIVSTKGKVKQWDKDHYTTLDPIDTDIPIVILIGRGSASASEIVAGAMQDLDRAVILGQRSFGKGLVQTTRQLKYNTQLKVTTAKYYIPSGRCIQALDYTNRNEDGSVGYVPDSLVSEFSTRNGRKVYDGGGIIPDIQDTMETLSQATIMLYADNKIFDFATDYVLRNPTPPENGIIRISNEEYRNFKDFVITSGFTYETRSENALEKLIETAKEEKYYELASDEFDTLKKKLAHNNEKDLEIFKEEIKEFINEEIAGRYFYQRGRIRTSVKTDKQIEKATSLLIQQEEYDKILNNHSGS